MSETGWHRASRNFTKSKSHARDDGHGAPAVPPRPPRPPKTATTPEPAPEPAPLSATKPPDTAKQLAKRVAAQGKQADRSVFAGAHGEHWAPRAVRRVGRLFTSDSYPERLMRAATDAQKPVTTGRRIVFLSPRGGSGKTTTAALAGCVFTATRNDPIAMIDNDPGIGTLRDRLGVDTLPPAHDLLAHFEHDWPNTFADLGSHLERAHADLYACACDIGNPDKTTRLFTVLSRYFPVTVIDSGPMTDFAAAHAGAGSGHTAAAIANSHAAVVTVPASAPGVASALASEDAWDADDAVAAVPRLYVPVETDARSELSAASAAKRLRDRGLTVRPLPYDRHLSGGRGIQLGHLAESTRLAATSIAGAALSLARGVT